jgi:hypothetical protein
MRQPVTGFRRSILAVTAALGLGTMLPSCTSVPGLPGLSAAASMRIEVEVYTGPLSQEPDVQWGELRGLVRDTPRLLGLLDDAMLAAAHSEGYLPSKPRADAYSKPLNVKPRIRLVKPNKTTTGRVPVRGVVWGRYGKELASDLHDWCGGGEYFTTQNLSTLALIDDMGCLINAQLHADALRFMVWAEDVYQKLDAANNILIDITSPTPSKGLATLCDPANPMNSTSPGTSCKAKIAAFRAKARSAVSDVAELAVAMQASSFYWASSQIPFMADSDIVATFLQSFALVTAELSNQINSRADALAKQFTHHRSIQPTSVYLRNTDPTDFANLYVWNRPFKFTGYDLVTNGSAETRLIGVERLYGDHNWSKINTVHANGQGDVAMAFIKDDIGNWNLKTFQNDPAELLDSYTSIGKALIKTATTAAGGGGLGAVSGLLGLGGPINENVLADIERNAASGRRIAFGGGAANVAAGGGGATLIDDLRDKTLAELERLKTKVDAAQEKVADVEKAAAAKPASGSIAFERPPEGGDTVAINGEQFEFANDEVSANERASKVYRGKTRTDAVDNLVAALTQVAETRPAITEVTYARDGEGTLKLTAVTPGKPANDIVVTASRNAEWDVAKLMPPKISNSNKPAATLTFDRLPIAGDSVSIDGVAFTFAAADDEAKRLVGIVPDKLVETVTALREMITRFATTQASNASYTVEQPGTPAIPATTGTPAVPATPGTPAIPATAGTLAIPATPGTPAIPATPGTPAIPATLGTPAIPATAGTPAVPATPGTPAIPATPGSPAVPATPGTPAIPATAGTPAVPATPGTPAIPATPGTPAIPATPGTLGPSIKIVAVPSDTARETISLATSRNTVVTKMSGGADKTEPDIDATGLTALKKDADRILREYQIRIETLQKLSVPPKAS